MFDLEIGTVYESICWIQTTPAAVNMGRNVSICPYTLYIHNESLSFSPVNSSPLN
ncbi:hypothetical protein C7212DRAFT_321402 [Tuber magnatum]|uniref:Uncharacterized protein n=1 Tax=Tuber magnatum TaxID=42249 RepID=A0A317SNT0_9PEZI|nr:hypothetical protein C7212DRAFT_321620 [Tuber magnatum]PWW76102.1 hypothetical protein C7212DRAFT_321402 [Tuber magnatum]